MLSKFNLVQVENRRPPALAPLLLPGPDELLPGDQLEGVGHLPPPSAPPLLSPAVPSIQLDLGKVANSKRILDN